MTKRYTVLGATIGLSAVLLSGAFANTTLFNNDKSASAGYSYPNGQLGFARGIRTSHL
jgi:hypothetical protein